jgi:glutamine synthetase
MPGGRLNPDDLRELVRHGAIDTVVVAFPDLQGRLLGKRVTGWYFCEHLLAAPPDPLHVCDYLLTVDVDMEPLPGYRFASWEQGYGDMACLPDLTTLRVIPWLERTALAICDLHDEETGAPVSVAPRQILRRQLERARALGFTVKCGSELEFFLFRDTYEEAEAKGYRDLVPHSSYLEDYHVLQTTKDEYLIREIRNGMDAAGVPVEFSKGEFGRGQQEINLLYGEALEMADRHTIYKNGVKEIAAARGRSVTFMAKPSMADSGSSCHLHSSLWSVDGATALSCGEGGPHELSEPFRGWVAGQVAAARELAWMYAPYVNSYKRYQPDSWAPTAIVWGVDNRTCGFRLVGRGPSLRVESRIPGADANPYLAFAATVAAGLHGIEHGFELAAPYEGNAYRATDVERIPWNIVEAIAALESSTLAAEAFGEDVHQHLVNTARQEWVRSNQTVTDWELRRNFERI